MVVIECEKVSFLEFLAVFKPLLYLLLDVDGGEDAQRVEQQPEHAAGEERPAGPAGEEQTEEQENAEADPEAEHPSVEDDVEVEPVVGEEHRHRRHVVLHRQLGGWLGSG